MELQKLDLEYSTSGNPFHRKSRTQLRSINSQELDLAMVTAISDLEAVYLSNWLFVSLRLPM